MSEIHSKPIVLKNPQLEESLLGCAFFDAEAAAGMVSEICLEDFQGTYHRNVYAAIRALVTDGKPVDLVTVSGHLTRAGQYGDGAQNALIRTVNSVSTAANLGAYIREMKEIRHRRQAVAYAEKVWNSAQKDFDIDKVSSVISGLPDFSDTQATKSTGEIMQEAVNRIAERFGQAMKTIPGNETGFRDLDYTTGGIKDGELIILTAEPNVGKSLLAHQICITFAKAGKQAFYFNFEMNEKQVGDRTLAIALPFDIDKIKYPKENMSQEDIRALADNRTQSVLSKNLKIFTDCGRTLADIKAICIRYQLRNQKPELIVIDYMQLMDGDGLTEVDKLNKISVGLKRLAAENGCPVICITSLNKQGETRGSKQIDYDADQIWKVTREHRAEEKAKRAYTKLEVLKNRDGGKGVIDLTFVEKYLSFRTLEKGG